MLPMRWSFYEPEQGEMRTATFSEVEVNGDLPDDAFAPSELVTLMMRSPEEIAAANERLRAAHADLLGKWKMIDGPPLPAEIDVEGGFLRMSLPGRPEPAELFEPDDQDSMAVIAFPWVQFKIERDESGKPVAMTIVVGGEAQGRLERADASGGDGD